MNIIYPIPRLQSKPVGRYSEIKAEAGRLLNLISRSDFRGRYKSAWALSHVQVSMDPYRFFVVHKNLVDDDFFEHQIIVNPRIIDTYSDAKVEHEEACISFPEQADKKIDRFKIITVEYWIPVQRQFGWIRTRIVLEKVVRQVSGLAGYILQHEVDHMNNKTIYD